MPSNLYKALELERTADATEIKKAYRRLSLIYHPDKAPADKKVEYEEKFKEINAANEILSDEKSRAYYDQTGEIPGQGGPAGPGGPGGPGGHGGMPFNFDMGDLFGMFGGRGGPGGPGGRRNGRRPGKAPARKTQIPMTLKDFYFGRTLNIHLERQRFCGGCKGEGATNVRSCGDCGGSGQKVQMIQMGPMIMQNVGPCMTCVGSGKTKGDACSSCSGSKFTKQDKGLELNITKGMKHGDTIVFSGESSNVEEFMEPGDVLVEVVAADEDHSWERQGDNLRIRVGLTLGEALCGKVVRLDGHPAHDSGLFVNIPAGVQNRQDIIVEGCGMPSMSRNSGGGINFGDVVLSVTVMPTKDERALLLEKRSVFEEVFGVKGATVSEGDMKVFEAKPLSY